MRTVGQTPRRRAAAQGAPTARRGAGGAYEAAAQPGRKRRPDYCFTADAAGRGVGWVGGGVGVVLFSLLLALVALPLASGNVLGLPVAAGCRFIGGADAFIPRQILSSQAIHPGLGRCAG